MESEFGIPVLSIVKLKNLIAYLKSLAPSDSSVSYDGSAIDAYRIRYGVEYWNLKEIE